jgi:uncharacterized protein YcfJ
MKNFFVPALAALSVCGSAIGASDIIDTAQVISAKPIIERVTESNQVCDPAPAQQNSGNGNNIVAPIIGGVVGGLIGHQVGSGRGQTAATIVGAAGGAVAGSAIANRSNAPAAPQCRTVQSYRDVINGYDVVYRYNGHDAFVKLPYNPGPTLRVGVNVLLDERAADAGRSSTYNYAPPPPPQGNPPPPPPRY